MPEPVTVKVEVQEARYYSGDDAIVVIGQCEKGQLRHLIPSSSFSFGNKDKITEMTKLAEMLVGKIINIVFDPDLNDKIKDKYGLKYK